MAERVLEMLLCAKYFSCDGHIDGVGVQGSSELSHVRPTQVSFDTACRLHSHVGGLFTRDFEEGE
jgi:hypothetical protein